MSLEDGIGLENKIGVALAEAMQLKPQFVWSDRPAIYIVRDYLDKKLCDVVIGLDTGDHALHLGALLSVVAMSSSRV